MCCTLFPYRVLSHWVFPKGFNEATSKHTMSSDPDISNRDRSIVFFIFISVKTLAICLGPFYL